MTITKESITDTIEGLEQLTNRGIQSVYIDMAIAGMRRLLAVEGQEPVISVIFNDGWPIPETVGIVAGSKKLPDGVHEFYAAPQPLTTSERAELENYRNAQQVVPAQDDADPRDEFEKVFPIPAHVSRCGKGYAVHEYNAWSAHDYVKKWDGWNACRAAMLNQTPKLQSLHAATETLMAAAPGMLANAPKDPDGPLVGKLKPKSEHLQRAEKLAEEVDELAARYRVDVPHPTEQEMDERILRVDIEIPAKARPYLTGCAAGRDGECNDPRCPQLRDGEPEKSGRHCPLDVGDDDE